MAGTSTADDLITRLNNTFAGIKGESMDPALQNGWSVGMAHAGYKDIASGDIIVFKRKILVCHRVLYKANLFGKCYMVQKGDNSGTGGIITQNDIIGKVIEVFDEQGCRVDESRWRAAGIGNKDIIFYSVYLFMCVFKRLLFGDSVNKLTRFIERLLWQSRR